MPSALPDGDPAPATGGCPQSALAGLGRPPVRDLRARAVLPVRCGYCDFNTYTLTELGVDGASVGDLRRRGRA